MNNELSNFGDHAVASLQANVVVPEGMGVEGSWHVECHDKDGNLKWSAESHNLVVNVGLQDMNAKYFTGSSYTATWYLGLVDGASTPTYAAGDTSSSHTGWTENTGYSNSTRVTCSFGTATTASPSVITNSSSPAAFSMNATSTIAGAFLISNSTKGGSTGTLFSEASFSSPGNRSVANGDTLNVTYTFSLA